jgi:hypothetical protein
MTKEERDYMEHLPGASVPGKLALLTLCKADIQPIGQLFQHGGIKRRMGPSTVRLVADEPQKGCASSAEARGFHGR